MTQQQTWKPGQKWQLLSVSACLTLKFTDSKEGGKRVPECKASLLINLKTQAGHWQEGAQT